MNKCEIARLALGWWRHVPAPFPAGDIVENHGAPDLKAALEVIWHHYGRHVKN